MAGLLAAACVVAGAMWTENGEYQRKSVAFVKRPQSVLHDRRVAFWLRG